MASLIKRGKYWYVLYRDGGRRRWISTRTGKRKIAEEILNRFRVAEAEQRFDLLARGKAPAPPLAEFVQKYLETLDRVLAPRWLKIKRRIFETKILPFFGPKTPLDRITAGKIEAYRARRLREVGARTINVEIHHCLLPLLRKAAEWGELDSGKIPKVKKLQEKGARLRFLESSEIVALREMAEKHSPHMAIYVDLMLYAGLRPGEAIHLRWADVDFPRRALVIAPREQWSPKTRRSRVVPTPDELLAHLTDLRRDPLDGILVVGRSWRWAERAFPRVVRYAGLPRSGERAVTARTLRHTYASHLVMAGVPLYTVAALLGHTTPRTTQIYAHLAPDYLQSAVAKVRY